jgi:glycosyltransferase involved in cell wall biosynthesis
VRPEQAADPMSSLGREIWFWQGIVTPHIAGLAAALARQGCEVVYVAEQSMTEDRISQGWTLPNLGSARLELAPTMASIHALVKTSPVDARHVCMSIRANGLVHEAQRALAARGLLQWVIMETVDDTGWRGIFKRLEYRRLFMQWRGRIEGMLAIGYRTPAWVVARGMPAERVFPFAYFLPDMAPIEQVGHSAEPFRFVFVGNFVIGKRFDLLISALAALKRSDLELVVIGSGPLEGELRAAAEAALQGQVRWIGRLSMSEVPRAIARADCLVLPSRHDGWGAVISEALLVGTPAICSDRCGAAGVVQASGHGGVFRSGDVSELRAQIVRALDSGPISRFKRDALAAWARCIGADAGATYLGEVLAASRERKPPPPPPWNASRPSPCWAIADMTMCS